MPEGPRALLCGGVLLLVILAWATLSGTAARPLFSVWIFSALHLVAIALLVWRALLGGPGRGLAIGFAVAVSMWLAGWIHHFIYIQDAADAPFPSISDGFWLLFYPACFGALVSSLRTSVPRELQRRFWTDGLLLAVLLAGGAVAIVVDPLRDVTGGDGAAVITNLAYPLGCVLLLSLVLTGGGLRGWAWNPQLRAVGLAFIAQVVADATWLALNAAGIYERGTLLDVMYPAIALGLAFAAWQSAEAAGHQRPWNRLVLTGFTAISAVALLAAGTIFPISPAATALALITLVGCGLRAAAITRHLDALRASRDEALAAAMSDDLTGLGNRRAFRTGLQQALDAGGPVSVALLNLRRLNQTNQTEGARAGDDRFRAVAARLCEAAGTDGGAYRLGGATFALVLPRDGWEAFTYVQLVRNDATGPIAAGVAEAAPGDVLDDMVQRADSALLEARRSQRRVVLWSPDVDRAGEDEAERHNRTLATALARAVDAKDSYTRSHSETVAECCVMIGGRLGLPPQRLARLRLGGLLHDVGKIGIPDAILQKPGALTHEEWEIMRSHSRMGSDIVLGAELEEQADWILHHHERVDGCGYPDGLAGEDIPLESRIIHVADAFEAMTADRPYRRGRPAAEALEELRTHAGIQFDPMCVEALCTGLAGREAGNAAAEPAPTPAPAPAAPARAAALALEPLPVAAPRAAPRPALPGRVRIALWVLAVAGAISAVQLLVTPGQANGTLDTMLYNGIVLASGAMAMLAGVTGSRRRPALLLGLGLLCWGSGNVVFTLIDATGDVPIPSPADPLYLLFNVCSIAAVGMVVAHRMRHQGVGVWLDGIAVALGAMALLASTVLASALAADGAGGTLATITALAYPLADILLLGVLATMAAVGGQQRNRSWVWLVLGTLAFLVSDSSYLLQSSAGVYATGGPVDIGWLLAGPLYAVAAWMPLERRQAPAGEHRTQMAAATFFGLLTLVLLVVDHFNPQNPFVVWLCFGTGLAVLARTVHAFRDRQQLLQASRREALTDSLTGLANRRALMSTLDARLGGPAPEPMLLVLFDLDGFKLYNDTFGHPAGDALLVRLATKLGAALPSGGQAFRMGGDEFCALVPLMADRDPTGIAVNLAAALTERGSGFAIGGSWGEVRLPAEATTSAAALRIADDRLYDRKRRRRSTAIGGHDRQRRPGGHSRLRAPV